MTQERLSQARAVLDGLRRRQRRVEAVAGAMEVGAAAVGAAAVVVVVEAVASLPPGSRVWLGVLWGVAVAGVALGKARRLLSDRRLKPGTAAEEFWALQLGQSAPEVLRDRLLNALQVVQEAEGGARRDRYSGELARHALAEAVADLGEVDVARALDMEPRRRAGRRAGFVLGAVTVLFAAAPSALTKAAVRLAHPARSFEPPPPFTLSVDPAGGWVYRGEPVTMAIAASGQAPRRAELVMRQLGGEPQSLGVELHRGKGEVRLEGLVQPIKYYVRSGTVRTPEYSLEVVARPQVAQLKYRLVPPAYSKLPAVTGPDQRGDVEGLAGSRVQLKVRATKPLAEARILFFAGGTEVSSPADDSLEMQVEGRDATGEFILRKPGRYQVRLVDREGHRDRDPVSYLLQVTPDLPPVVTITEPLGDVDLGDETVVRLEVQGYDDFAVGRLRVEYRIAGPDSAVRQLDLPAEGLGTLAAAARLDWDLGGLALMPGDAVEYWAAAWDNDTYAGPKRATSPSRFIRLPTVEELIAGVDQTEAEGLQEGEKLLDAAREVQERVARVMEEMKRRPEGDWERRREIEDALETQTALQEQAQELKARVDELVEHLAKHDLTAAETLQKYQELQRLMEEIVTPELREAMQKLKAALDSQDPEAVQKAMEEFDQRRQEFLENIERSLNILKQLQLERKLDELARRVEDLLRRQEAMLNDIPRGEPREMARTETHLAEAAADLPPDLGALAEQARTLKQNDLASALDKTAQSAAQRGTDAKMRRAADELQAGRREAARPPAEQARQDLAQLHSEISRVATDYRNQRKAEIAAQLRRLAEELLMLSAAQEGLAGQSRTLEAQSPRFDDLAGMQEDVREGLAGVTERTFALAQETFFVTPELGAALGQAAQDIERARAGFATRNPRTVASAQRQALGDLNRAAAEVVQVLGQLSGASSATGFEQMMERLTQMADAQQGLNQQSMSLPMPGAGGGAGAAEQLARMAAQQRALQQAMEQAAQEAKGMAEILGDLEGIAEAMGEVAKDFEAQNVTERTRRLQRQIVSRLLDATRSAREEQFSRNRESRTGKDIVRKSPAPVKPEDEVGRLRRDLLRALQEGYSRDYRQLIQDYFQELERSGAAKEP